jgi:putative addiction module component (TIGR02574 family)
MGKLKDEIMKLSKAEQYEIYEAIESTLFGQQQEALSKEQKNFIDERLNIIDSGKATFVCPDQLRQELDKIIR